METTPTSSAPVTTTSVGLRYGLLTGLGGTIISFGLNAAKMEQSPARWLSVVVLIAGIVLAQQFYKQQHAGFMSYGEGMSVGFMLSLISGIISGIFSFIYVSFIDTEMIGRIMETTRADMEKRGMPDDQIDQAMHMTERFMTPEIMSFFAVVGSVLFGLLFALIISAIIKNPKPEFE